MRSCNLFWHVYFWQHFS